MRSVREVDLVTTAAEDIDTTGTNRVQVLVLLDKTAELSAKCVCSLAFSTFLFDVAQHTFCLLF